MSSQQKPAQTIEKSKPNDIETITDDVFTDQQSLTSDSLLSSTLTIPRVKEDGWTLVFLVSMTLGVILFGFGLKSIVGYTLNRKAISTQTLTPDQMEELYSELRSSVLLLMIGILLIVMMFFSAYKSVMSYF